MDLIAEACRFARYLGKEFEIEDFDRVRFTPRERI